jgi:hypothetical protein
VASRFGLLCPAGREINGLPKWWAKRDIIEMIDVLPGGLAAYLPQMRYFLLEIGAVDEGAQLALKNLAAALMRLEKSSDPAAMFSAMADLIDWLSAPQRLRLRRVFTVWIKRVLLPGRMPGLSLSKVGTVLEAKTMLAERVNEWTQKLLAEGQQAGVQVGQAKVLRKQLESRFGPLPDWALMRLNDSSEAELDRWCLRVLSQATLQTILD